MASKKAWYFAVCSAALKE